VFKSQEKFRFASSSIPILINGLHGGNCLLRLKTVWTASHRKDIVEEEVELIDLQGSRIVSVIFLEDLVDVGAKLLISDTH